MTNKIVLESLVMDLKRVAIGYHRGSVTMAKRFSIEALKRKKELNQRNLKPYITIIINNLDKLLEGTDREKIAEDSLMFSIILQNYTQRFL